MILTQTCYLISAEKRPLLNVGLPLTSLGILNSILLIMRQPTLLLHQVFLNNKNIFFQSEKGILLQIFHIRVRSSI